MKNDNRDLISEHLKNLLDAGVRIEKDGHIYEEVFQAGYEFYNPESCIVIAPTGSRQRGLMSFQYDLNERTDKLSQIFSFKNFPDQAFINIMNLARNLCVYHIYSDRRAMLSSDRELLESQNAFFAYNATKGLFVSKRRAK